MRERERETKMSMSAINEKYNFENLHKKLLEMNLLQNFGNLIQGASSSFLLTNYFMCLHFKCYPPSWSPLHESAYLISLHFASNRVLLHPPLSSLKEKKSHCVCNPIAGKAETKEFIGISGQTDEVSEQSLVLVRDHAYKTN